jgi:hypothetical protein
MKDERDRWLEETEKFFGLSKSYNTSIISIGYATFFGCLIFLSTKTDSPLLFWAVLALVLSATVFVSYELMTNIRLARECSRAGEEGKRVFRRWKYFFLPSLALGAVGVAILVVLILIELA